MYDFNNSCVFISGGTGSFGSSMVKNLLKIGVGEVRVFSRDESKQHQLRLEFGAKNVKFILGDVRDQLSVQSAIKGSDYVFHAAALKQVPSCEFFPIEAVKTNVIGASNVLEAAINANVKSAVVLSTDKAVYPINAMGQSKALMEKVAVSKARNYKVLHETKINVTRYGNVLASRGSVIPIFIDLAKQNKPLSITELSMTRFLMSLEDAVELVYYALIEGENADILVKKSPGASLATIIETVLKVTDSKSSIENIGIRHGEKLHESLLSAEEKSKAVDLNTFYRCPADTRDLNYADYFDQGVNVKINEGYTSENTEQLSVNGLIELFASNKEIQGFLK